MKRKMAIICVMGLLVTLAKGQELRIVKTDSLYHIAKEFGLDSALSLSKNLPIYKIDSLTAISLLDFVFEYSFSRKSEYFFRKMAHNWKIPPIQEKTYEFAIDRFQKILSDTANTQNRIRSIEDRLLIAILVQRPDSMEKYLIDCYNHCLKLAESYKKLFPPTHKRFFHFFKEGYHSTVLAYKGCHMNCYKIMWTLGQLGSSFFDTKKLSYHNNELENWQKNPNILKFQEHYKEYEAKEITLNQIYNSIDNIDFATEPELLKILQGYKTDKCWTFILCHEKLGFLDIGCRYAPLAGYGYTYKIELYEPDKIRFTIISAWIS